MENINTFRNILNNFTPSKPTCYNPKTSTIEWSICDKFKKARIKIANSLDKNASGIPKKGEKRFDHEHAAIFSMDVTECGKLYSAISSIIKGEYNQNDSSEKKGKLVFEHYPEPNKKSCIIFEPARDGEKKLSGSLRVTIIPPKEKGTWASYTFRTDELKRFMYFMENCAKNLEFLSSIFECLKLTLNMAITQSQMANTQNQSTNYSKNTNQQFDGEETPSYTDNDAPDFGGSQEEESGLPW